MRTICPFKLLVERGDCAGHLFSTLKSEMVRLKYSFISTKPEMCSYYTGFQHTLIPKAAVSDDWE